MTVHTDMLAYYAQLAPTYDRLYEAPERQKALLQLRTRVENAFAGHEVLELACGTGYWTGAIAASASRVLATDVNVPMIEVARAKHVDAKNIEFALADAYALHSPDDAGRFDACFAGCWWSHVPRERQAALLDNLRDRLTPGARLVLLDDIYIEGDSIPVARTDAAGNTYQIHRLDNGERHEILKNFPTDSTLRKRLGGHLKDLRVERFEYYWLASGRFK